MQTITDLNDLLTHMQPELNAGRYAFVALPNNAAVDPNQIVASVKEQEGLTVIVSEEVALDQGWEVAFTAAWITLNVYSDLAAVGLTAAVSGALAKAGISCNVIAGVHHDHLFVPIDRAHEAMKELSQLSSTDRKLF